MPLIDLLTEAQGISLDLTDPNILNGPLGNEAPATALALIERGARMDIRHATLGPALWSAYNEPRKDHLLIIETLIAAGAQIEPDWNKWIDQLRH